MHFFGHHVNPSFQKKATEKNRVKNISWFTMFFVIGFMVGPLLGTVFLEGLDITYRVLFQITVLYFGRNNNHIHSWYQEEVSRITKSISLFQH